jgi:hypothetical protein
LLANHPDSELGLAWHNIKWLEYSSGNTREGYEVEFFSSNYQLTQLIKEPTKIPHVAGHQGYLLDLFLTSCPNKYSTKVVDPLESSDHCVISTYFLTRDSSTEAQPKTTIRHYKRANWVELNS